MSQTITPGQEVTYQDAPYVVRAVDGNVLELAYQSGGFFRLVHLTSVTVCTPPATQTAASLDAPAAGQGEGTSLHGEVGPAVAHGVDQLHHVLRDALISQCLRFVAETGDRQFAVLLWDALELQAHESTGGLCLVHGHEPGLSDFEREFAQHLIAGCAAGFVHAAKVIKASA